MDRGWIKVFKRVVVRLVFYFFYAFLKFMPWRIVEATANFFFSIGFLCVVRLKRQARESLRVAFQQEKTAQEIEIILKKCFYGFGKSLLETGYCVLHPSMITERMRFAPGAKDKVDAALATGRGVIAVTAHMGNFPLMLFYFAQLGYKTNAVIRPSRDEALEKVFIKHTKPLGLNTVHSYPREHCVNESINALRRGEILFVLLDQNTGSKSRVMVNFFGKPAGTLTGPIVFAQRTGAVILPIFTVRDAEGKHVIEAEDHFELSIQETQQETLQLNIQRITDIIERYVRRFPSEWSWMHKRWKS